MQKQTLEYLLRNIREFEDLRVGLERKVESAKRQPKLPTKRLDDNSLDILYQKVFSTVCTATDSYSIRPTLKVSDMADKHKELVAEYWPWMVGAIVPGALNSCTRYFHSRTIHIYTKTSKVNHAHIH